jgi:hypothetical protein
MVAGLGKVEATHVGSTDLITEGPDPRDGRKQEILSTWDPGAFPAAKCSPPDAWHQLDASTQSSCVTFAPPPRQPSESAACDVAQGESGSRRRNLALQTATKSCSVWSALLHAERSLRHQTQRLNAARKIQAPNAVDILGRMLKNFSKDVISSRCMQALALDALAAHLVKPNETPNQECACFEWIRECSNDVEKPKSTNMSVLHAHGIMHAAAQLGNRAQERRSDGSCPRLPDHERQGSEASERETGYQTVDDGTNCGIGGAVPGVAVTDSSADACKPESFRSKSSWPPSAKSSPYQLIWNQVRHQFRRCCSCQDV